MWDVQQYLKFSDSRSRPFFDLLAQVPQVEVATIADLGCGPGNLTRTLAERWPTAQIVGVDSSPEMLAQARQLAVPGRLDFVEGDIASWSPMKPLDLIVSNAALQWVGGHATLIPRLAGLLANHGTLAVQIPNHVGGTPMQRAIEDTVAEPRWAETLKGIGLNRDSTKPLAWYATCLLRLGFVVNAWEATYLHVLTGQNPALEWLKGTALRPFLEKLQGDSKDQFLQVIGKRLKRAYPAEGNVTLFPFPRLFFVASRALAK